MKLITFITIIGFSLLGCTNDEERKAPDLSPEQQEEFEF